MAMAKPKIAAGKTGDQPIYSAGEVLPDGAVIELVSGLVRADEPRLIQWNRGKAKIAPTIQHGGVTYEPIKLPPSLCRATRLAARAQVYGSESELFTHIAQLFKNFLSFPDRDSKLLSCFCLASWVADRLPTAPSLAISTSDRARGIDLLRLLHSVCRHPLLLGEVTSAGLRSLPPDFAFTLLISGNELNARLQRLLRNSNQRGMHIPGNRGTMIDLYGPKAVLLGPDAGNGNFGDEFIQISAPGLSYLPLLTPQQLEKIANDFQPKLLTYRLKNCVKLRESSVDISQFTPAVGRLALAFATCFPEDTQLASEVTQLLRAQDEEVRSLRFLDVNYVLIEILLAELHAQKGRRLPMEPLTRDVNALLLSRGEIREYSAEEAGWKLRQLDIPRHSASTGRFVLLDRTTSQRIHQLARLYSLPCDRKNCSDCSEPGIQLLH